MEACCAALATEDRKSGGASVSSGWGKVSNVTLPRLDEVKEEVEEMLVSLAELWMGSGWLQRDDELTRGWRSLWQRQWPSFPPRRARREEEGRNEGRGEPWTSWRPVDAHDLAGGATASVWPPPCVHTSMRACGRSATPMALKL
jgi:hypothetical protein